VLCDLDFSVLITIHEERRPALSIAVHHRQVTIELGVVDFAAKGVVTAFREKPRIEYDCSMGVNSYSPRAVQAMAPGEAVDFPHLALRLIGRGESVLTCRSQCYWMDIGRRDDYARAQEEFSTMRERLPPDEADLTRTDEYGPRSPGVVQRAARTSPRTYSRHGLGCTAPGPVHERGVLAPGVPLDSLR
jgi:NDP-sugar pyrophosphorylase family protein